MRVLLLLFIVIPLTEMLLLFEVADRIGSLTTLGLVVLTAVIGVQILKRQGLSTLVRANRRLESGELPAQEIVEGMLLAGAGALLLTPGFITDTLGFIFLTGPLRRPIARRIISSGMVHALGGKQSGFRVWSSGRRAGPGSGKVFEGEIFEQGGNLDSPDRDDESSRDHFH